MTGRRSVWWLWPSAPILLVTVPTLVAAAAISPSLYERAWRTPKGVDGRMTVLLLGVAAALVVGMVVVALAERSRVARPGPGWPDLDDDTEALFRRAYPALLVLTALGYGVWITIGVVRGLSWADVATVLTTQDNFRLPVKSKLDTLPGVTTLTQAAIPAAVIGILLDARRPSAAIRWGYRTALALAAARSFMLAERLAVVEIVVPIAVVRATVSGHRAGSRGRALLAVAPLLALVLLVVGFTVSEYSRSWNWYSAQADRSFVDFASERLLGYYATSHNNGALLLDHGQTVGDVPYHTTSFMWQIPPGSQLGGTEMTEGIGDDRRRVLRGFGNPEFNSPGGLSSIVVDYGVAGGLLFAVGLGAVVGLAHLAFLHGRPLGLLLYPVLYTGLLELPRYLYWFQGRATPAIAVALALAAAATLRSRARLRRRALEAAIDLRLPVGVGR